jgi:hypothetical protein
MVDELQTQPVTAEHCPWCSAEIAPALSNCPACGATLTGDSEASLPGVTALDPAAIARGTKVSTPQRRSRLLSWISGEYDDAGDKPAPPGSLSPPPFEVRREMLRLEIEAETAILQAETDALAAEAALEAREHGNPVPAEAQPAGVEGSESPADAADAGVAGDVEERSA